MSMARTVQLKARARRGRTGNAASDQIAAGPQVSRSRYAWGELPLIQFTDPHGPIVNVPMPGPTPLDYTRQHLLHLARTHEIVNACLRIRADRLIDPVLVVERTKDGDTWEAQRDHPLLSLARVPGEALDTATFWRYLSICWDSVGAVYLEPIRSGGLLVGVNPLDPQFVTDVYAADGTLQTIEWYPGYGDRVIFQPDQLIVRRRPLDIDPAPLMAALRAVDQDLAFEDYIRSFFLNSAVPSGIIKVAGGIHQEIADQVREAWMARFGGQGTFQNGPAVLDDLATYQEVGSKLSDLDNDVLRKVIESRIAMPFQVPPLIIYSYLGVSTATYSNLQEAWRSFWDSPVLPLLREWSDWVTRAILPYYEDPRDIYAGMVRARFDTGTIPALQEDTTPRVTMFAKAYDQGIVSVNEYRAVLGLDGEANDPAADELAALAPPPVPPPAPPQLLPGPMNATLTDTHPAIAGGPPGDIAAGQVGAKALPIVHNVKATLKPPARLDADVTKYLKDQYARARRLWIAGNEAGGDAVMAEITSELDKGIALFGILAPHERKAYSEAWREAANRIDWAAALDTGDVTSAVDVLARRCVGISETTRQEIADVITKGAIAEQTDAEIAAALGKLEFERSTARAPLITRTELAVASSTAARDAYTASGQVASLTWLTGPDPCPECQERDGKTYDLASAPEIPQHPACRCDYAPVLAEVLA